jgi:protein-tyrosine phosphatase
MQTRLIALLLAVAPLWTVVPATAKQAVAVTRPSGAVERSGNQVTVKWNGLGDAVTIWQVPMTDAAPKAGKQLIHDARGGEAVIVAPASPRLYLVLRDSSGRETRLAERLLPLEGGVNFRDLGGYETVDGKTLAWGKIYRSGVMSGLTAADYRTLADLGIGAICDFRASDERIREPVDWPAGMNVKVLTRDYKLDMAPLMAVFGSGDITEDKTRAAMASFYGELPFTFAPQFKAMFAELLKGEAPLAFNCSAGKDRTGMAALLILSALGVSRETAIADYLLSNRYFRPKPPQAGVAPDPSMAMFARLPPDVIKALMGVDRRYIEASLASIDTKGGMESYLRDDMGLGPSELARLHTLYLRD